MTPHGAAVWRHSGRAAVVDSGDRIALLDLDHLADPPRVLEGSAAAIWRAVDGVRTTPMVVESVAGSYGVPPAELEADVLAFLDSLATAGLLEGP